MAHPRVHPITTVGGAGVATGQADGAVAGAQLVAVDVDLAAGQPANVDLTITSRGRTVLTLTNLTGDTVIQPRVAAQDGAGADIAGRGEVPPFIHGDYTVALELTNPAELAATVRLFFEA
jgi:hypothetical protein